MYDFYSDTKTKPTYEMRKAALECEVGDEQKDEDPTTRALLERVAQLLGKEAAVFLPSGTMCNEIAIKVHTDPGDEIICDRSCHIINFETGGPAAFSGVMIRALDGTNGIFTADEVRKAIRPASRYAPRSALLCVEQTANLGGGAVWPLEQVNAVAMAAKSAGIATHMDGARLLNAVVKSGVAAKDFAEHFDSVWIDFSKGLGAPAGAVLAGSEDFVRHAWRLKQQIGGAMRQSGFLAATCLYALDHHVERLAEDHELATHLGEQIARMDVVASVMPVETNIVIFDIKDEGPTAEDVVKRLHGDGIVVGAFSPKRIRLVTHLGVDAAAGKALMTQLGVHLKGEGQR